MTSVLSQLYDCSDLIQAEQASGKRNEEEKRRKAYYHHYEAFQEKLDTIDPSLKREFSDIIDEQANALSADLEEWFLFGFRLGARIIMELFQTV